MPYLNTAVTLAATAFTTLTSASLFTVTASQPGGPLNGKPINAAGGAFYIGIDGPASYCPPQVEPNCPVVTGTTFANSLDSLWVAVPGGQRTYIRPEGSLGFTAPHSAFIPPGSYQGGWVNITVFDIQPTPLELFGWSPHPNPGEGGIAACPTATDGVYQVNAKVPTFTRTDCITLLGLKPVDVVGNAFGAWEYT